jgi:hypothetical protein
MGLAEPETVRRILSTLALSLLAAGCGSESAVVDRLAAAAALPPAATPKPTPAPTPALPPSPSNLVLAGDVQVEDAAPDVVAEPLPAPGREPRLRLEVRHRVGGSSTPDAVVVFLNVPAKAGSWALHSPRSTLVPGRVYAFVTTRGEALGSMKDFNSGVAGTLTLRRDGDALAGSFRVSAREPPPPPPPQPKPGQPPARPIVGTIPPEPPKHVQASGTLMAMLPSGLEATIESAAIAVEPRPARRRPTTARDLTGG